MKTMLTFLSVLMAAGLAQASVSKSGGADCTIKQWDKKFYELACDPRAPKITLRTPAEWVKEALQNEKPAPGKRVEITVTGEKLRAWLDMNKKTLAKADAANQPAPAKKKGAK